MLLQFSPNASAQDAQWHRWQKDLLDLHEAIREACMDARMFLQERPEAVTPRRGKRRLPRRPEY